MIKDLDTAIESALYARLAAWTALTVELELYQGSPAIFTRFPIPEDAPDIFVVIGPPTDNRQGGSKTSRGRENAREVTSYTLATGDPSQVNRMASEVLEALRRWQPDLTAETGARVIVAGPSGPIVNDGDGTYGRAVTARFTVHGA